MALKILSKDCNCAHCQQKIQQVKHSRLYWDKLTINRIKD